MKELSESIEKIIKQAGGTWGISIEDLNTNDSWNWNENEPFYAASIIKVPIMVAVFHAFENESLSLDKKLILKKEDIVGGCGVLQHLTPGMELSIYDLTTLMIIQSDNTATNMLIEQLGKPTIQNTMRKTGLSTSTFYHKLMTVPVNREGINTVTAFELTSLLKKISEGKVISVHACEQMIAILKQQQIRNGLPGKLPPQDTRFIGENNPWEFAHKTGSVTHIRHEIGIFYVGKRMMIASVLSKDLEDDHSLQVFSDIGLEIYHFLNN
ncbi:serine hydrolase [Ornithinibacillus salinisoli]|uniref:Serine hydrolase n=1 Tax=Ornithinibacillus salinisoli TaxID=1848459 RepID=A0ABW4VYR1_9BACI